MTTLDEAREAIYGRFVTLWASRTPYTFQNQRWNADGQTADWVRVSVNEVFSAQETLSGTGTRRFRRTGQITCQIFVLKNQEGMSAPAGHADAFRTIFEGVSFGGIDTTDAVVTEVGPDGKWHQTNVDVDFDYTEIK